MCLAGECETAGSSVRGASVGYLGSGGREANGPRYRAPRASRPDNLGIKCLSRTSRHERQALWCRGFPSPSGRGARRRCRSANVKHRPLRSRPRRGLTPPAATRIRAPVLRSTPSGSTAPVRKSPACIPAQNTWSKSGRIRSEYIATAHHLSRCCNHRKNPRLPQRSWRDLSTPSLARYRDSQPREVLTGTTRPRLPLPLGRGHLWAVRDHNPPTRAKPQEGKHRLRHVCARQHARHPCQEAPTTLTTSLRFASSHTGPTRMEDVRVSHALVDLARSGSDTAASSAAHLASCQPPDSISSAPAWAISSSAFWLESGCTPATRSVRIRTRRPCSIASSAEARTQ
ncbi:hypothetical protein BH10ACT5_BH10ACT5_18460 [soil metagenome]